MAIPWIMGCRAQSNIGLLSNKWGEKNFVLPAVTKVRFPFSPPSQLIDDHVENAESGPFIIGPGFGQVVWRKRCCRL